MNATTSHLFVLGSVTSQLTTWIGNHGAYAVFAIMAIDALLPVGGELTMLFAGALAAGAISGAQPVVFGHVMTSRSRPPNRWRGAPWRRRWPTRAAGSVGDTTISPAAAWRTASQISSRSVSFDR